MEHPSGQDDRDGVEKLTEATDVVGHHVAASKEEPQYPVESEKSGKQAAYKPEAFTKANG